MSEALDESVRRMLVSSELSERQVNDAIALVLELESAGARPTRVLVKGVPAEGVSIEAHVPVEAGAELVTTLVRDRPWAVELAGVGLPVNDLLHVSIAVR